MNFYDGIFISGGRGVFGIWDFDWNCINLQIVLSGIEILTIASLPNHEPGFLFIYLGLP